MRWRKKIPAIVDMSDSSTMVDACSNITERSTETVLIESAQEWKRKFEEVQAHFNKKQTKRRKRISKKTARLKVSDIPKEDHLMQSQKYTLQCLVRKVLWRSIKYWHEDLEEKVVKKALKNM